MHRELRNSLGYLKELGWIATSFYLPFRKHYQQIIKMKDLMIFVIRVNGELAGVVEIEDRADSWFVGYWVGIRFRRKGLATACILDILKHDLPYRKPITARVAPDNTASKRVLEKIGLTQTHTDSEWAYYKKYT
jgi:RimJ/RimL family protein N-acetyltransferase